MSFFRLALLGAVGICIVSCSDDNSARPGYVEGRYVYAASYSSGYLENLYVHRGQMVKAGDILFVLNNQPETDELAEAQANTVSARETWLDLQLGKRPSEIESAKAQIRGARATADYSNWLSNGKKDLYQKNTISKANFQKVQSTALSDSARVGQLQADLNTDRLGSRIHQQLSQKAAYQSAEAALSKAKWVLSTKIYRAPKSGFIDDTFFRQGEFVSASQPILSLLAPNEVKIIFYVPEPKVSALKAGDSIRFTCDGCKSTAATIDFVGSQAEYTPPVLYSRQARKSLVYRVEATIPEKIALNFHPGQPVSVYLPDRKSKS